MSIVNICLACDNNYSKYAGVTIASILTNAKDSTELYFYILDGGISENRKNEITSLKKIKNCQIHFIKINEDDFEEYKKVKTHKYITLATYYRLKLTTLLPKVNRVIYLDCDTVVNTDLTELFNIKLTTQVFAGVNDINKKFVEANPTYVNAGVLVIDLEKMREQNLEQKFLDWTIEHQNTIQCGDQEIINEVCLGNIKVVNNAWNVQTSDFMNRSSYTNKPLIIHFIAKNKPWNWASLCYYKNYYIKYLQITPWAKNKWQIFEYKYIEQFISLIKFLFHRPTFIFMGKYYEAIIYTYLLNKIYQKYLSFNNIKTCENPKVSIIVPVYNIEKYLPRCLNSLSRQTFDDLEIICINDGSTDNSERILEDFASKNKRIKIIKQNRLGVSAARNCGLKHAKGKYVAFVDSDDWISLNFINNLYKAVTENDADIAVAEVIRCKKHKRVPIIKYKKNIIEEDFEQKLKICDVPTHCHVWNKLYKKQVITDANITFAKGRIYEDMLFTTYALFHSKKIITVPDAKYYYFRHKKTLVKTQSQKAQRDFNYAIKKMYEFFNEKNIDVSHWETKTKKYKIFGLTVFKKITKNENEEKILFNCIKW